MESREWRTAIDNSKLEVSNFGEVRNALTHKLIKQSKNADGYCVANSTGTKMVHRMVAMAFIENPESKPEVNHKDTVKHNNHISNLEWMTHQENCHHAAERGLMNDLYYGKLKRDVKIKMLSLDGIPLKIFDSIKDAYEYLNYDPGDGGGHINKVCSGKRKKTLGYKWEYCA